MQSMQHLWRRRGGKETKKKSTKSKYSVKSRVREELERSCGATELPVDHVVSNFVHTKRQEQGRAERLLNRRLAQLSKNPNSYYEGRSRWGRQSCILAVGDLIKTRRSIRGATSERTLGVLMNSTLEVARSGLIEAEQQRVELGPMGPSDADLEAHYQAVASIEGLVARRKAAVVEPTSPVKRTRKVIEKVCVKASGEDGTTLEVVARPRRRTMVFAETESSFLVRPHVEGTLEDVAFWVRAKMVSRMHEAKERRMFAKFNGAVRRCSVRIWFRSWRVQRIAKVHRRNTLLRQGLTLLVWNANQNSMRVFEIVRHLAKAKDLFCAHRCLMMWNHLAVFQRNEREGVQQPQWLLDLGLVPFTQEEHSMLEVVYSVWLKMHVFRTLRVACIGALRGGEEPPSQKFLRKSFRRWLQRQRVEKSYADAQFHHLGCHFDAWAQHVTMLRHATQLQEQQTHARLARTFAKWQCRQAKHAAAAHRKGLLMETNKGALRSYVCFMQRNRLGIVLWKCWRKLKLHARWNTMCAEFRTIPVQNFAGQIDEHDAMLDSVVFCDVVRASPAHMYRSVRALQQLGIPFKTAPSFTYTMLRTVRQEDLCTQAELSSELTTMLTTREARALRYDSYVIGLHINKHNDSFTMPLSDRLPAPRTFSPHKRKRKRKGAQRKRAKHRNQAPPVLSQKEVHLTDAVIREIVEEAHASHSPKQDSTEVPLKTMQSVARRTEFLHDSDAQQHPHSTPQLPPREVGAEALPNTDVDALLRAGEQGSSDEDATILAEDSFIVGGKGKAVFRGNSFAASKGGEGVQHSSFVGSVRTSSDGSSDEMEAADMNSAKTSAASLRANSISQRLASAIGNVRRSIATGRRPGEGSRRVLVPSNRSSVCTVVLQI